MNEFNTKEIEKIIENCIWMEKKMTESNETKSKNKRVQAIADFNYLWGMSMAMCKALGYSNEETEDIGYLYSWIDKYLQGEEDDVD